MTDLLDENIRRLVNEVVDGAPTALQPPEDFKSDLNSGRSHRPALVGAAAVLILITIVGGVFLAVREPKSEQVELADSAPVSESLRLPSIFDRPRTSADELPADRSWMTGGGVLASGGERLTLELEDSRRGLEVDETTLWVVPFTSRRGACWTATQSGFDSSARGCVHLDNDDLTFGVAMITNISRSQGPTGTTTKLITSGLVFRDEIVDVVGGTLEDGVFVHPSETDPVFVFSDGKTARQSDATNDESTVPGTSLEASENYRLPSVLERPRNDNDQLPEELGLDQGFLDDDLDLEASRLGIEAHGTTVWVVPSVDRRKVCWSGTVADTFATSCVDLDQPSPLGVGAISVGAGDDAYSFGVLLNADVVGVVGGTLKDGVFVHPSEAEPIFVFNDGSASKLYDTERTEVVETVTNSSDPDASQVAAFCEQAEELSDERPESYVGSSEHLADLQALARVSPAAIASELDAYAEFLSSGAIDPDNDPDSTLSENWPEDVQNAVGNIQDYAASNC